VAEYEEGMQPIEAACYAAAKAGEMTNIAVDLSRYPYIAEDELALLDKPKAKTEKLAKVLPGINRNRQSIQIQRNRMTRALKRNLKAQGAEVARQLNSMMTKLAKAAEDDEEAIAARASTVLESLDWDEVWGDMPDVVADSMSKAAEDGVATAGKDLQRRTGRVITGVSTDFANEYGIEYAATRGAEMIGKRRTKDGKLVDNPDARWAITDQTRKDVLDLITQAMQDGWSNDRLADEIQGAYAFSAERAEVIARTETALADSQGNIAAWKKSGVVKKKRWLTAEDDLVSEECAANGKQGPIDMDEDFESGDTAAPAHPNCRCAVSPVIEDEGE